ncbi:MAG: S9 family peptidase [Bacteroidetes bacterium]|nr:S9 family peptidase [Bacteroidota bacterium]
MRLLFLFAVLFTLSTAFSQLRYPETRKATMQDSYFGTTIADPYRWLEDDNSEETKAWVTSQNQVTNAYLAQIPFRDKVKDRLSVMWNYPKYGSPRQEGDYYYFSKNDGLQNQSVLYRQKELNGKPEVFLDPNSFSKDGTIALAGVSFSKNARYAAYQISSSGSDWQEAIIQDLRTGKQIDDTIRWIKFSGLTWQGDEGFYYSRYPEPDVSSKLSKQNQFHKVYFHPIGTSQQADVLIYEDNEHPLRNVGAGLTEDGRFLFISTNEGTSGNDLRIKDQRKKSSAFIVLVEGFQTEPEVVDHDGRGRLIVKTNQGAPNYKLVLINPSQPAAANWITLVPEKDQILEGVGTAGGYLFCSYLKDASTKVYQYTYEGKLVREIQLPGIGTASGFSGKRKQSTLFYTFTSYTYPPTIFQYNIATGTSNVFRKTETAFSSGDYETRQVFFSSKDGTKVPMFITGKKGFQLNGNNPVLLYGYGGFNISMTPSFSISNAFWMEQGGLYVVVNLRGGSEYGESWHQAGMLGNKQNVFDDFIAAAEYLIDQKYTNRNLLAIRGGSNGGLLVGACMTQRPDLFKVALPAVGVLDMLRYHLFTIGWAWAVEYGRSDNPDQFPYLLKYSPLHQLKDGVSYPATLVTTADHDDRVVPAHSFKFATRLQEAHRGTAPVLIRIESKAGHGAGKPTSKQIEEAADIWSFVMHQFGMGVK